MVWYLFKHKADFNASILSTTDLSPEGIEQTVNWGEGVNQELFGGKLPCAREGKVENHTIGCRVRVQLWKTEPPELLTVYCVKQPRWFLTLWTSTWCFWGQQPPLSRLSPPSLAQLLSTWSVCYPRALGIGLQAVRICCAGLGKASRIQEFAEGLRLPCQRHSICRLSKMSNYICSMFMKKMYSLCFLSSSWDPQ